MKKLIPLLTLLLFSCGEKTLNDRIQGKWKMEGDEFILANNKGEIKKSDAAIFWTFYSDKTSIKVMSYPEQAVESHVHDSLITIMNTPEQALDYKIEKVTEKELILFAMQPEVSKLDSSVTNHRLYFKKVD